MSREPAPAGIAGVAFLAAVACVTAAGAQHALLIYGPAIRAWLLSVATPQFGAGIFFGMGCVVAACTLLKACR